MNLEPTNFPPKKRNHTPTSGCWSWREETRKWMSIVTISRCDLYVSKKECVYLCIHIHIHVYVHMHLCKPHKWAKQILSLTCLIKKLLNIQTLIDIFIKNYLNEINKCMILNFIQRFIFKTIIQRCQKMLLKVLYLNKWNIIV